jgi:hypothetical protein
MWVATIGAAGAAIAAIASAILAGMFARSTKKAELQAESIRDLENRISEKKHDVYKPTIDLLGTMMTPGQSGKVSKEEIIKKLSDFSTWVSIYGSDDSINAYRKFAQAAYNGPTPVPIMMRLYADFILEARKDMGYTDTSITPTDFLSLRITDIYKSNFSHIDLPFNELCEIEKWTPPWPNEIETK